MKKFIILLLLSYYTHGQIQNPPYISCDGDVVRTLTVENHDELIFHPGGRLLLLQPKSELHIWNRISTENIPDAAFLFGRTGIDSIDVYPAKVFFHNCESYFNAGEWLNPETGEYQQGEVHFDRGYGDTGNLGLTEGKIEIYFDCETLSTNEPQVKDMDDKELYEFDSIIYNIKGQKLYQGKFGNAFYYDRILEHLREQIIFRVIILPGGQQYCLKGRIYKYR